mmetsp:Transcript_6465/g.10943  ORF Transcript_6465/g.10943 Transcript_6465/m.10943 type:complete len:486 (-) Transcript_6465:241-1698(-)
MSIIVRVLFVTPACVTAVRFPHCSVVIRRGVLRLCATNGEGASSLDAQKARLRAERLSLQAERAALEAEKLDLRAAQLKLDDSRKKQNTEPEQSPSPPPLLHSRDPLEALKNEVDALGCPRISELQDALCVSWVASVQAQRDEILKLKELIRAAQTVKGKLSQAGELTLQETWEQAGLEAKERERTVRSKLSVDRLWDMSEKDTSVTGDERRRRSRKLSTSLFSFLRSVVQPVDGDDEVAVPEEGIVALASCRKRLALLEQHEMIASVEYRIFGELLSSNEAFESVANASLNPEEADRMMPVLFGQWMSGNFEQEAIDDIMADVDKQAAQAEGDDAKAIKALEQGLSGKAAVPFWLDKMGELLTRADGFNMNEEDGINVVPLFLLSLCGRQGSFEPTAVYIISRILARVNVQRIAAFTGRAPPADADKQVSLEERALFQSLVNEAVEALVVGTLVSSVLVVVLLWQLSSLIFGLVVPTPPDPLAF